MAKPSALYMLGIVFFVLGACSPLQQLRRANEDDRGDFRSNLAAEYLAFAESEAELGHKKDSTYLAEKGLRAAQNQTTPPENPVEWEIPEDLRTELNNARERYMRVRNDFFQRVAAQSLARAQVFYDCWVMQAAQHRDNDLTLPCRSEFLGELDTLEQIVDTLGPSPKVKLPAHYTILFGIGSTRLDTDAAYTVEEVLAITRLYPDHLIEIVGHTDRAGSQERNLVISTERAANTAAALADVGIDPERINFSGEGEDNPAIPTLDGVYRERNRRVEISVLPLQTPPAEAKMQQPEITGAE